MCVRGCDSSKKAERCVTWGVQVLRSPNLFKKNYSSQEAENAVISQCNHPVDIHIFHNAHATIAWQQQTLLQETLELERTTYCTLYTLHYALYTVLCTLYTVRYTLCAVQLALCTVDFAVYTVHCTLCEGTPRTICNQNVCYHVYKGILSHMNPVHSLFLCFTSFNFILPSPVKWLKFLCIFISRAC